MDRRTVNEITQSVNQDSNKLFRLDAKVVGQVAGTPNQAMVSKQPFVAMAEKVA